MLARGKRAHSAENSFHLMIEYKSIKKPGLLWFFFCINSTETAQTKNFFRPHVYIF